jgi:hypothetical protein
VARIDWRAVAAENTRLRNLRRGQGGPDEPVRVSDPAAKRPELVRPAGAPKLCVDCEWHRCEYDWMRERTHHLCVNPRAWNPVTGAPTDPFQNRRDKLSCGPQAVFWHQRPMPAPALPKPVRADLGEPQQYVPPVPVRRLGPAQRDQVVAVLWERAG